MGVALDGPPRPDPAGHQILTISEHTASDAVEHLGIRRGTDHRDPLRRLQHRTPRWSGHEGGGGPIIRETLPKIRPGFLLYVGGDDHRKNMDGTLRAYAQLPESMRDAHQLVIAFRVGILRRLEHRAFAQALGIRPRDLVLTGFVTDEQLAALYRRCELFLFPSLYEGAGLPILEAMSCGAPVAASRTTSIPELLGDLEATFDPANPADMARCLEQVLSSPEKLEELRERSRDACPSTPGRGSRSERSTDMSVRRCPARGPAPPGRLERS